MNDLLVSYIRTFVPVIVGSVAAWLAAHNVSVDADTVSMLTAGLGALFIAIYYGVIRALEIKFPKIGVLLGSVKQPSYTKSVTGS